MAQDNNGVLEIKNSLMCSASKNFFVDGMKLAVPVYLKIKDNHYLLIGKKEDKANFSTLHSYQNPTTLVFVKKDDYLDLIHHVTGVTESILNNAQAPISIKTKFIASLADSALSSLDGKGVANVTQLQRVSQFIVGLGKHFPDFNSVMQILAQLPENEAKHAMATALISVLICEEMGLVHKAAVEKVALGSLLHDVGLNFIPKGISGKAKHLWTPEEYEIYEQHPLKGAEILRDLKDISADVLLIVAEHHENAQGTGFPKRIRDIKISPLGRVVGLADHFAELLFNPVEPSRNNTADEAINFIENILGQPYNKQTFQALKKIINKQFFTEKQKAS